MPKSPEIAPEDVLESVDEPEVTPPVPVDDRARARAQAAEYLY